MNRNITGTIRKTDGTVWAGAVVEFELERSSYDQEAQYPSKPVRAVAGEDGELDLALWVNEEGLRPSKYICTLPDGSQFRFILPAGEDPVDLNELRESSIEEDSPTESQVIAFLPVMRQEARTVVQEELIPVNAEIDTKADQSALDATNANVGQITQDVDALNHELGSKADQSALDTTNANLAALDAEVDTKASQAALNTTNTNLAALDAEVDTKASQAALDTTNSNLAAANAAIATKASQAALNTTNANLAALDAEVDTKANQSALDTTNASVQSVRDDLDALDVVVGTKADQNSLDALGDVVAAKADQSALNATDANVSQLVQDVDALSHDFGNKADQSALDITNANLATTNTNLAALDTEVDTKASQAALNTTNTNLAAANALIATKANQSSLNLTNTQLNSALNAISQKASQDDMNAAFQQIGDVTIGLDNTNTNLAALDAEVDTKANQSALNTAILTLQDAILTAQITLQGLIDQKADIAHIHQPGSIRNLDAFNAISYFDADGFLTADNDQLTFADGMLGLGTAGPEFTIDLRSPVADAGAHSRMMIDLNTSSPTLQLAADITSPGYAALDLQCHPIKSSVLFSADGRLMLGSPDTAVTEFAHGQGSTFYRGMHLGHSQPTTSEFPESGSFGFFVTNHGQVFLVFNYEMGLYMLEMSLLEFQIEA